MVGLSTTVRRSARWASLRSSKGIALSGEAVGVPFLNRNPPAGVELTATRSTSPARLPCRTIAHPHPGPGRNRHFLSSNAGYAELSDFPVARPLMDSGAPILKGPYSGGQKN